LASLFFFSSRRRHTRFSRDWSSDVCSSDLRAEDRKKFERLLAEVDISQPPGTAVTSEEEALTAARRLGFPVLVRPSYVLGGRAIDRKSVVQGTSGARGGGRGRRGASKTSAA